MYKTTDTKPRVGISSCLVGMPARYTGGHAGSTWFLKAMSEHFSFQPVCPEIGAGLGVPREPVRLVMTDGVQRLVGRQSGSDYTKTMAGFAAAFLEGFKASQPHGFILKKKSPSCGLSKIPVYGADGKRVATGAGLFAALVTQTMPALPVEDEGRLNDPGLRANFIERVFAYRDWQTQVMARQSVGNLLTFHTSQKLALMARSPKWARELGRLVANAKSGHLGDTLKTYETLFTKTMKIVPSSGKHANVLQHLMGYLKHDLDRDEKVEVLDLISKFQRCHVPLSVPLTLLRHHLRKLAHPWVETQSYLKKYPENLMLHQAIGG